MANLKKFFTIYVLFALIQVMGSCLLNADTVEIIKNPKPNLVEKQYTELTKVRTLNPDLGSGEYLFKPFSITTNGTHIYIYDNLQTKLFKLDKDLNFVKSVGRKGRGPGEFSGTGKVYPVFIRFGRDGLLYAYDVMVKRLTVFDSDLKFLRIYINIPDSNSPPIIDDKGNQYYYTVDNNKTINVLDKKKTIQMTVTNCMENFRFLLKKPRINSRNKKVPINLTDLVRMEISPHSELLTYIASSSTLIVMKNGEMLGKKYLWPRDALKFYENDLEEVIKINPNMFRTLFFKIFVDEDVPDNFYLQYGLNREKGINSVYQFNVKGELLNVLYVNTENLNVLPRFELKVGERFYAVEDTNLTIYKISEVRK